MTGPSASGSLKGTPSSTASAPAATSAGTNSLVASRSGNPAVKKRMSPVRPSFLIAANFSDIRSLVIFPGGLVS